ncbi:hypothetical protein ACKUSY_03470 [Myroides odoratus]
MKINRRNKISFLLIVLAGLSSTFLYAQYPYFNSGQKGDDFKLIGESSSGLITYTPKGIKLLDGQHQFVGIYLDQLSFTTEKGFILEFEFGLDQGRLEGNRYGDGITMVLFDASEMHPKTGDKGGALGYAHTQRKDGNHTAGFSKGMFGLGLDLFGNYKRTMNNYSEVRNGVRNAVNNDGNFVVLRGPHNPNNLYEGYPVLFAVNTVQNLNYFLNIDSGKYISTQSGVVGKRFEIRGGSASANPGEHGYRKIRIAFIPGFDDASRKQGFFISVTIVNGSYNSSIVRNFFVPKTGVIRYGEQLANETFPDRKLNIAMPASMKLGFTGGTGDASIRAHIRNIALVLPFSPVVQDITIPNVIRTRPFVCEPLYSAYGYDTNVFKLFDPPSPSTVFLDFASFRFKILDEATKTYVVNSDPHRLVVPNVGEYSYNINNGEVTFSPVPNFQGDNHTFHYDIKNKKPVDGVDISTEEYRSSTASVTLSFTDDIPLYRNPPLIVNKGVRKIREN